MSAYYLHRCRCLGSTRFPSTSLLDRIQGLGTRPLSSVSDHSQQTPIDYHEPTHPVDHALPKANIRAPTSPYPAIQPIETKKPAPAKKKERESFFLDDVFDILFLAWLFDSK